MNESKFFMSIDFNVLNHLGINLYSNIAAVLSEAVANAYDADASEISIDIINQDEIVITDNGCGMNVDDINDKFLKVGYQKRSEKDDLITPLYNRKPMGRKGIGKLSLMSIAKRIEIHTKKEAGIPEAFLLDVKKIEKLINEKSKEPYYPEEIVPYFTEIKGTKIILKDIRKNRTLSHPEKIRKDLARRFMLTTSNFKVKINGETLKLADREYFKNVIKIFKYGDCKIDFKKECSPSVQVEERPNSFLIDNNNNIVTGWIGYVEKAEFLKFDGNNNLNKISVLAKGKVGQEDILGDLHNSSMFTNYLIGEIEANFLDGDKDLATSSREGYQKESNEYIELFQFIRREVAYIGTDWNKHKENDGLNKAVAIEPYINTWFESLEGDEKSAAKKILGNINRIVIDESKRKEITKYGILAFEKLKYSKNLSLIENLQPENIIAAGKVLRGVDAVEGSMYYQIVKTRLDIIDKFESITNEDSREKVIQQYLFEHLWLLDPSWERPTSNETMERSIKKIFNEEVSLTKAEQDARLDICFKDFAGKLVVVELKKYRREITTGELHEQTAKYSSGVEKCLKREGKSRHYEIIFILGKDVKTTNSKEEKERQSASLKLYNTRIVFYDELISNARNAYKSYLDAKVKINSIIKLFEKLETKE